MPLVRRILVQVLAGLVLVAAFAGRVAAQGAVAEVDVAPPSLSLKVGQTQGLYPQASDAAGNVLSNAQFTYSSRKPAVATVTSDGKVTGVSPGSTQIIVRSGRKSSSVFVLVNPGENPSPAAAEPPAPRPQPAAQATALPPAPAGTAQIVISPRTVFLLQTESDHLIAKAVSADGTIIGPVRAYWKSLTPAVVSVIDSVNGDVSGVAPGIGSVQASGPGGYVTTATVEVVAINTPFGFDRQRLVLSPDQVDTLELVVPSQSSRPIEPSSLAYHSSNEAVVTVGTTGIVQAKGPGQADITAQGYLQTKQLQVVVHRPIAYFLPDTASGSQITVPLDGFRNFTVKAQAADSTIIPEVPFTWTVTDTALAQYDTLTHHIIGRKEGLTTLTLSVRGYVPKAWGLRIVPGGLGIDHKATGMVVGGNATLAAELRDARGIGYGPAPEVRWISTRPDVAKVADGKVSAVGAGSALIVASVPWGRADTAKVFVTGDLLLSSDRRTPGVSALVQTTVHAPDNILPLFADSGAVTDPALSPDRMRIAYAARTGGTDFDIWVMDADGRNAHRLTSDSGAEVHPVWTPDGKSLVYSVIGKDRDQLWQITVDGRDRRPLTIEKVSASGPEVSPDGKWVAYVGGKDRRKPDVFLRSLTKDTTLQITETKQKENVVGWFPNGDLAYASDATDGSKGFVVMRLVPGTTQRTIVATSAYPITDFSISRDGGMIAYVTEEPNPGNKQQRTKTILYLGSTSPGSAPRAVATPSTEMISSPAF